MSAELFVVLVLVTIASLVSFFQGKFHSDRKHELDRAALALVTEERDALRTELGKVTDDLNYIIKMLRMQRSQGGPA